MLSCHWSIVSLHWEKSQCISIYQRRLLQRRRVRSSSEQLKTITCILVFLKSNTELYMLPTRHVAQLNRFEIIFIHHPYLHHQLYLFLSLLSLSISLYLSLSLQIWDHCLLPPRTIYASSWSHWPWCLWVIRGDPSLSGGATWCRPHPCGRICRLWLSKPPKLPKIHSSPVFRRAAAVQRWSRVEHAGIK